MTLHISSVFTYDEDAGNYIQAVEAADEADTPGIGALEPATRQAINNFVVGCKQDGIWDAIKASCILAGARTLEGALQPLVGAAPTNNNFVSGDYNRKTGLKGQGSNTVYLSSNFSPTASNQANLHLATYNTEIPVADGLRCDIGNGFDCILGPLNNTEYFVRLNFSVPPIPIAFVTPAFYGASRSSAAYTYRLRGSTGVITVGSIVTTTSFRIFGRPDLIGPSPNRLAFYSIGESLDLAKLDGRVTDLITAFGAAIP